jgi:hypothetical protein
MTKQKPFEDLDQSVVASYTRREAVTDGFQIDISEIASEAGICYPVFITRTVYDQFVTVPPGVSCQDEQGRLWDIVWMLASAIRKLPSGIDRLQFQLYVRNSDKQHPGLLTLLASCGPVDIDDPKPSITIMLPDED